MRRAERDVPEMCVRRCSLALRDSVQLGFVGLRMAAREEATVKFVAVCAGLEKNRGERKSCEEHFNAYKACKEQDVRASPPKRPLLILRARWWKWGVPRRVLHSIEYGLDSWRGMGAGWGMTNACGYRGWGAANRARSVSKGTAADPSSAKVKVARGAIFR